MTCGSFSYNRPREDGVCPFCKKPVVEDKPAPAPFDAAKWASDLRYRLELDGRYGPIDSCDPHDGSVQRKAESIIAAALTSAHESWKAEDGQPRLRYEVLNAKKEVIAAFRDHYSATVFCNGLDGRSVVDTQPAPPAEKEPPHAN